MFSTLTILSLFAEIFTAGVLITGSYVFVRLYLQKHGRVNLYLGLIFSFFSFYVIGVVSSQLMTNIGTDVALNMLIQRLINAMLIFSAVSVVIFAAEKSNPKQKWFPYLMILMGALLCYFCFAFRINLVYRFDIIEPIVDFRGITIIRYFWFFSWVILGLGYIISAIRNKDVKERNLEILVGLSAVFVAVGYIGNLLYITMGNGVFLLLSWVVMFFAFSGFLLGNIISPKNEIALNPLNYIRTRILFKLVMLFIMMIVLIVEATTLATISTSRASLLKAVIESDKQIAVGIADKVRYFSNQGQSREAVVSQIQESVEKASLPQKQTVYVVDLKGRLLAHPDAKRAALKESMSGIYAVKEILNKRSGGGEFRDELGDLLVGSYIYVPELKIGVVVSEPIKQAYSEIRKVETNSLVFVIIGIVFAVIVGMYFAKNIERQVNALITGTDAIRKGNLSYRIKMDSLDEIGRLATEFNLMTTELKESQDHLIASEKLAALGTMAAGMAHEIKNPLVALRTFTQLMPMKWEDKEFREKFEAIVPPEIDKINRIAENLLKFGKPSKPEFKQVNINTVLEEVLELLENQFKKNNIRVATKFAQVPAINGDGSQLSQAFLNIILNAVQAMPEGGELVVKSDVGQVIQLGKITNQGFESLKPQGEKSSDGKASTVFVEITDSGSGVPEEKMKNLFDPFFTTKETGTGMGLPITLRIVEDHKGSIKVRSQAGKGTTFIIMLPAVS